MMRSVCLLLSLGIVGVGCAGKPSKPDWIDGQPVKYSAGQYLLGRGSASSPDQAQERARADLATIFHVTITAEIEDVQTVSRSSADGRKAGSYEQRSAQRISTRTEQAIRGIRIAELWQDPATRNHHALAVLQRSQAANALREEVERLDAATRQYLQQSRVTNDAFLKIGAVTRAIETQTEREGFQRSLKVVDTTGLGMEAEFSSSQLVADRDALLKGVRIAPRIGPDADSGLDPIVRGALAASGFLIESGDKPEFLLEARLVLEDLGLRDGWFWQRGTIDVSLFDTGANRVRGTRSWAIKGAASSRAEARQRALREADELLKKNLRGALTDIATTR